MNKKTLLKRKNSGFTLIELLAVIAILSVVVSIGLYFGINIVNKTKEKGYQVTIKNVEDDANNYISEKISNSDTGWATSKLDSNYEYQCVSVQNLIDTGYLSNDVLEANVTENRKVMADDNVYLERDSTTKSITMSMLLYDEQTNDLLCNNAGNITFEVSPSGWAREKNVTIKYNIYNLNDVNRLSNYNYNYNYDSNSRKTTFNDYQEYEKLVIKKNTTIYASIKDISGNVIYNSSLIVGGIDRTPPTGSITSTNNVASKQTVTLSMSDSESLVSEYYFGKSNPNNGSVVWIDIEDTSSVEETAEVSDSGTYYLGIKDAAGNMTVISKVFYKTTLSISNASVSPSTIITMNGNSFTVPTATPNNSKYIFKGWYSNSSYTGSAITTYKPTSNSTLYGQVIVDDKPPVITFGTNGSGDTWRKEASTTIKVTDEGSGVDTSTLKYTFTDSTVTASTITSSLMNNGSSSVTSASMSSFTNNGTVTKASVTGNYYVVAYACDNVGNCTTALSNAFKLDNTAPTIAFGTNGSSTWKKEASTTIEASDEDSGVDDSTLKYTFSSATLSLPTASITTVFTNGATVTKASANGEYYLWAYACDNVGNCTTKPSNVFKLDNTAPVVTCDKNHVSIQQYHNSDKQYYNITTNDIYQTDKLLNDKYKISYDNNCSIFFYVDFTLGELRQSTCEDIFVVSDNSGVISSRECNPYNYTDEDGHTYGRRADGDNCIIRATSCNCVKGYCNQMLKYTVKDQAGNQTVGTFNYYFMYEDAVNLRGKYCDTTNGNAILDRFKCVES